MKKFDPAIGISGLYFQSGESQWSELAQTYRTVPSGAHLRWATSIFAGHPQGGFDLFVHQPFEEGTVFSRSYVLDFGLDQVDFPQQPDYAFLLQFINRMGGESVTFEGQTLGSGTRVSDNRPIEMLFQSGLPIGGIQFSLIGIENPQDIYSQHSTNIEITYSSGSMDRLQIELSFLEQRTFYLPLGMDLQSIRISGANAIIPRIEFFELELDQQFESSFNGSVWLYGHNLSDEETEVRNRIQQTQTISEEAMGAFTFLKNALLAAKPAHATFFHEISMTSDDKDYFGNNREEESTYLLNPYELLYISAADAEMARALGLYVTLEGTAQSNNFVLRANYETDKLRFNDSDWPIRAYAICDPLPDATQNPVTPFQSFEADDIQGLQDQTAANAIGNRLKWRFASNAQGNFLPVLVRLSRKLLPVLTIPDGFFFPDPTLEMGGFGGLGGSTLLDPPVEIDPGFGPVMPFIDLKSYSKRFIVEADQSQAMVEGIHWDIEQPLPVRIDDQYEYSITGYDIWGRENATYFLGAGVFHDPVPQAPGALSLERPHRITADGQTQWLDKLQGAFYWRQDQHDSDHMVNAFELLLSADHVNGYSLEVVQVEQLGKVLRCSFSPDVDFYALINYMPYRFSLWGQIFTNVLQQNTDRDFLIVGTNQIELLLVDVETAYVDYFQQPLRNAIEEELKAQTFYLQCDMKIADHWTYGRMHQRIDIGLNKNIQPERHPISVFVEPASDRFFVAFEKPPFSDYQLYTYANGVQLKMSAGSFQQYDREYALEPYNGAIPDEWKLGRSSVVFRVSELKDDIIYYLPENGEVIVYPKIEFVMEQVDMGQLASPATKALVHTIACAVRAGDTYYNWSVMSSKANCLWVDDQPAVLPSAPSFPTEAAAIERLDIPTASYPGYDGKSQFDLSWQGAQDMTYDVYRVRDDLLLAEAYEIDQLDASVSDKERHALENYRKLSLVGKVKKIIELSAVSSYNEAFAKLNAVPLRARSNGRLVFTDDDIDGQSSALYAYKLRARTEAGKESSLSALWAVVQSPNVDQLITPSLMAVRLLEGDQVKVSWRGRSVSAGRSLVLLEDLLTAPRETRLEDMQRDDLLQLAKGCHWRNARHFRLTNSVPERIRPENSLLDLSFLAAPEPVQLKGIYHLADLPSTLRNDPGKIKTADLVDLKNQLENYSGNRNGWLFSDIEIDEDIQRLGFLIEIAYADQSTDLIVDNGIVTTNVPSTTQEGAIRMYRLLQVDADGETHSEPSEPYFVF
ncbi:MAG: hypothetical protein AAF990_02285 [Bacteroidota bacterium]